MACFKPLTAFKSPSGDIYFHSMSKGYTKKGKTFKPSSPGREMELACGNCIGCRLDRSREWATRICHEAQLYDDNVFITLTYNPENLPPDCGLIKKDFQMFMRKLRRHVKKQSPGKKIKFFMCGEYGDKSGRPHYHAIIFNYNFDDWVYLFDSPSGHPIYTSPTLEKIWGYGFVNVGTVSFESAAYVARYILKKVNGDMADKIDDDTGLKHYERINSFTGEIHEVHPEYCTMSRGGRDGRGIAFNWFKQYKADCYPKDFTTVRGVKVSPPRYYDKLLQEYDLEMYDDIKAGRELKAFEMREEATASRLLQKRKIKEAQFKQLKRSL